MSGTIESMETARTNDEMAKGSPDHRAVESLPELNVREPDGDREHRRRALRRLDALLDVLERANLQDAAAIPTPALDELRAMGLERPQSYSIIELLEMVFRAQRPYLLWQSSQWQSRPST
jgi:hypothetical protein